MLTASGGADRSSALRRLNEPRPVEARAGERAAPRAIRKSGRWLRVEATLDRWRTDDRWWTERPVSRTYYELLLEDGRKVTVFRDEIDGRWWEQRYG